MVLGVCVLCGVVLPQAAQRAEGGAQRGKKAHYLQGDLKIQGPETQ